MAALYDVSLHVWMSVRVGAYFGLVSSGLDMLISQCSRPALAV